MENLPQSPIGSPTPNDSQPTQQPWAQTGPMLSRSPIAHPWAASPHAYVAPLLLVPGRIRGKLSDYREGWICMVPEGMILSGKCVVELWRRNLMMLCGMIFCGIGAILAQFLVENVMVRPHLDALAWDCVEEVVLNPKKGRMCIVYHLPDKPDKPFSLGLELAPPPLFHQFAQIATHYLGPEKVHEGKIGPPTPPAQIAIALGIVVVIVGGVILLFASTNPK